MINIYIKIYLKNLKLKNYLVSLLFVVLANKIILKSLLNFTDECHRVKSTAKVQVLYFKNWF